MAVNSIPKSRKTEHLSISSSLTKTMGILTDLLHARAYDEDYPTDSDLKEAIKELREIGASVKAKDERIKELEEDMKPKTCEWSYNEFDEAFDGKCGIKFVIAFDTPKGNNMNFCPCCGGKLIEIEPKEQL